MSTWGGGWFTAGSQANNSNKPFLVSTGAGAGGNNIEKKI